MSAVMMRVIPRVVGIMGTPCSKQRAGQQNKYQNRLSENEKEGLMHQTKVTALDSQRLQKFSHYTAAPLHGLSLTDAAFGDAPLAPKR